jgi:hypothetical protein
MVWIRIARLPLVAALLTLIAAHSAAAQGVPPNEQVFAAKFLCGFTDGRVARLNDPTPLPAPYRAVEPGNYATVLNVTSIGFSGASTVIQRSVHVEGLDVVGLDGVVMPAGKVSTTNCTEITQKLAQVRGFQNDGRFVEGYVYVSSGLSDPALLSLDVTAAYSYAVLNATGLGSSLQVVRIEPRLIFAPE